MKKSYNETSFDQDLDRFLRVGMLPEEELEFLAILHENRKWADRAYLSAVLIRELRQSELEEDQEIIKLTRP